jgi:hypothetical protein
MDIFPGIKNLWQSFKYPVEIIPTGKFGMFLWMGAAI